MFSVKMLESIIRKLLYVMLFVTPLLFIFGVYFPFTSSKSYALRFFIGMAFFFWVMLLAKSRIHHPNFKSLLVISILVFLAGYIITGFLGVDPERSFFSTIERSDGVIQYAVWTVYFLMAISVFRTKRDWQIALGIFLLTGFISSVFGLVNLHFSNPVGNALYGVLNLRLYGTFGNPAFFGAFLLFVTGFVTLFLTKNFSPFQYPLKRGVLVALLTLLAFFIVLTLMSQTRGDYVGFLAGVLTFMIIAHFFPGQSSLFKKSIIALDGVFITVIIILGFVLMNPDSSLANSSVFLKRISNSVESNSLHERLAEWQMALEGFKDKPLFGWGPENFSAVSNKYYDYRIGLIDSWFDRPHNQTLQILAEGGVTLFSGYLLVIAAIFLSLFRVFKKEPFLASLVGAIFVAYYTQDLFLFDTYATHICFFTLFGFTYYLHDQNYSAKLPLNNIASMTGKAYSNGFEIAVAAVVLTASIAFIWYTVWIPYSANPLVLKYNAAIDAGALQEADTILQGSFLVTSPYVAFDIRKAAGWELLLKYLLDKEVESKDKPLVISMYKKITPALAEIVRDHPYDPQVPFVLGSLYRLGYEQLGMTDDLAKSEAILRQALLLSPMRVEYVDAISQTFFTQKKFDEVDAFVKDFVSRLDPNDGYRYLTLGNYYYLLPKYDLAFEEYEKARAHGWTFLDTILDRDYDRYLQVAQETRNFEAAVSIILAHLEKRGSDAATYFNLAVALAKLHKTDEAKAAYQKALSIDPVNYKQYQSFFK